MLEAGRKDVASCLDAVSLRRGKRRRFDLKITALNLRT
jgi:hypothetical protein